MRSINGNDQELGARLPDAQSVPSDLDSPRAATPGREPAGFLSRVWVRCSAALRRAVLGRSGWDYLKQYTGSDVYWDNMLAAERGECRTRAVVQTPVDARMQQPPMPEPPR